MLPCLFQLHLLKDDSVIPKDIQYIFERVRNSADRMPQWQVDQVMQQEFGKDWRDKYKIFENEPMAAASIGQVHKAVLHDGSEVAVKIQVSLSLNECSILLYSALVPGSS